MIVDHGAFSTLLQSGRFEAGLRIRKKRNKRMVILSAKQPSSSFVS